jgi:hypothetical protein
MDNDNDGGSEGGSQVGGLDHLLHGSPS